MADLTLVQGVADLRLNEATLRRDLARARQAVLNTALEIERRAAIDIPVTLDIKGITNQVQRVTSQLGAIGGATVPIGADSQQLLGEILAVDGLIDPVAIPFVPDMSAVVAELAVLPDVIEALTVPIFGDADRLLGELAAATDLVDPITVPVQGDAEQLVAELTAAASLVDPLVIPILGDAEQLVAELAAAAAVVDPVTVPVEGDIRQLLKDLDAAADRVGPITIPVRGDVEQLVVDLAAAASLVDPIVVPVTADTDRLLGELAALPGLADPISIPVDLGQFGGSPDDITDEFNLLRIPVDLDDEDAREGLVSLASDLQGETISLQVEADTTEAAFDLERLADNAETITVPVDFTEVGKVPVDRIPGEATVAVGADTSALLTALQTTTNVDGVTIPITADTTTLLAELAAIPDIVDPVTIPFDADTSAVDSAIQRLRDETITITASVETIGAAATAPAALFDQVLGTEQSYELAMADRLDAAFQSFGERRIAGARKGVPGISFYDYQDELKRLTDEPVPITLRPNIDDLRAEVTAGTQFEPVGIAVIPNLEQVRAAIAALPVVSLQATVDTTGLAGRIDAIIDDLPAVTLPLTVDTTALAVALDAAFDNAPPRLVIPVDFDVNIGSLAAQLDALSGGITIPADVDVGQALAAAPPQFEQAGYDAGSRFGQSALAALRGIFTGAGVAVGGLLSVSLFRGFGRLTTIEDSVASLTVQLQSATRAATLLDEVLGVVTGTPFNLDQFAEAASNLVAFGVEAEKIPQYLTAISEVAATRGGRANEYAQRLAISFGQVAVQGRITNDEINQLALTGVPALQILGNKFGETTFNIREMISKGLVPADEALDALAQGILEGSDGINGATVAFEGTAEALRNTLTGAIGGFQSSTARLGASIIRPLQEVLVSGFRGATGAVDTFGKQLEASLGGFADSAAAAKILDFFEELPQKTSDLVAGLQDLGPALAPLAALASTSALGSLSFIPGLGILGSLSGPIGSLTVAIGALVATTPELREEVIPIFVELGETIAEVIAILGPALGEAVEAAIPVAVQLAEVVQTLLPVFTDAIVLGAGLLSQVVPAIELLADALNLVPTEVLAALTAFFVANKALNAFGGGVGNITTQLRQLEMAQQAAAAGFGNIDANVSLSTKALNKLGVTTVNIGRVAGSAASAIGGAFSGLALASDDATTQVTGLVGALGSIAVGAATGGPVGAGLAGIGAAVGFIAGNFIEAKREAEAFTRTVTASTGLLIDELGQVELAATKVEGLVVDIGDSLNTFAIDVPEISFADFDIRSDERIIADFVEGLGDDLFDKIRELPGVDLSDFLNIDTDRIPEFKQDIEDLLKFFDRQITTVTYDGLQLDLIEELGIDAAGRVPDTVYEIADAFGFLEGTLQGVTDEQEILSGLDFTNNDKLQVFLKAAQTYNEQARERVELERELAQYGFNIDFAQTDEQELRTILEVITQYGDATEDIRDKLEAQLVATRELQEAREDFWRKDLTALGVAVSSQEALIEKTRELADQGIKTDPLKLFNTGLLDGIGVLTDVNILIDDAEQKTFDAAAASEAWANAASLVADQFDRVTNALDRAAAAGDRAFALRNFGSLFEGVVNDADLAKAERIGDQIDAQLDRVRTATQRLEEAQTEFAFNEQIALQNIAEAEAAGATKGALAARRDLELDRLEVEQLAEDLAAEEQKLADLQAEAARFGNISAVTFGEQLASQAGALGINLFDLIYFQPTDESREAFKAVQTVIQESLAELNVLIEQGDLDGVLALIPKLEDDLLRTFDILGPDIAQALVDAFFDTSDAEIATVAYQDAREYADAVNQGLEPETAFLATNMSDYDFAIGEGQQYVEFLQSFLDNEELLARLGLDATQLEEQIAQVEEDLSKRVFTLIPDLGLKVDGNGNVVITTTTRVLREGGIVGGPEERHAAQIAHGFRFWAEPETGGEAYIPLTPDPIQRRRSTDLLGQVADIFGLALTDPATEATRTARIELPGSIIAGPSVAVLSDTERLANAVADGVGKAMVATRKRDMAREYAEAVHIENLHIGGSSSDRRTAQTVIRHLSDLSLRKRRR